MEVNCSFQAIVGGLCGCKRTDKEKKRCQESGERIIVPLLSCDKEIATHKSLFAFSEPVNEVDLILCRAAIFAHPKDIQTLTICAYHRYNLGLGWMRGSNTRCRVPVSLSNHGKSRAKWPKCERGVSKDQSQIILKKTGTFVPVGSGIIDKLFVSFIMNSIFHNQAVFLSTFFSILGMLGICINCRKKTP